MAENSNNTNNISNNYYTSDTNNERFYNFMNDVVGYLDSIQDITDNIFDQIKGKRKSNKTKNNRNNIISDSNGNSIDENGTVIIGGALNTSNSNETNNSEAKPNTTNKKPKYKAGGKYESRGVYEQNWYEYRTGIRAIDNVKGNVIEREKSIDNFGKSLTKAHPKLEKFGEGIQKASGILSGLASVIEGVIGFITMVTDIKNIKGEATSTAIGHELKEKEFQFARDTQLSTLETQKQVNMINYLGDVALKSMETQGNIMLQSLKIMAENQVKATEIAVGPLIDGINETAYKAAEYAIERRKDYKLLGAESEKLNKNFALFKNLKEQQYGLENKTIEAQKKTAIATYESSSMTNAWAKALAARDAETKVMGKYITESGKWGAAGGAGIGTFFGPEGTAIGAGLGYTLGSGYGIYKALNDDTRGEVYRDADNKTGNLENVFSNNGKFQGSKYNFQRDKDILSAGQKTANELLFNMFSSYDEIIKGATIDVAASGIKMAAEGNKTLIENARNVLNTQLQKQTELQEKSNEIQTEALKVNIENQVNQEKNWLKLAMSTEKWLDKFDEITNDLAINYGYTNRAQLDDFQKRYFNGQQDAALYGKSFEELAKTQQTFIENTGRNKQFGTHDNRSMMALGKYLGDDGLAASYASEMEIFNVGVADSVDMLDEVLQDVNKIGLNGRKYTKTLVDNLKLAQKYNFKDGTKGLMQMAKWAENTRFNMNSLSGMLNKVSEGGLEGIITQGAQFQVLGGHAAMNADPIAMMFERYANPQAFAKRMQDMTIGYGSFNRETGETEFSGTEQMLMEQIAKIQGRSYEDVANEVRARDRKKEISKSVSSEFTDDELSYIANTANYNKKTGSFEVKVKQADGTYGIKSVDELTNSDLVNLMPAEHNERMEDYMATVVDYLGILTGIKNAQQGEVGEATWQTRIDNYMLRGLNAQESFTTNFETYVGKINEYSELITKSYQDYTQEFTDSQEKTGESVGQIKNMANVLANTLGVTADLIAKANEKIAAASNIDKPSQTTNTQVTVTSDGKRHIKIKKEDVIEGKEAREKLMLGDVYQPINDGIITNNNSPILAHADNVTKMNDGLVKSDPKDVAIFAKEGGVIGQGFADLYNEVHSNNNSPKDINIHMDGRLELVGQNGQTIDLVSAFNNDPIALRTFARMLFRNEYDSNNGGRGVTSLERNYG